jgi:hypothetical protein
MSESQCLWYALDKWHSEGGYLVFRKSTHWFIPHVLHLSADKGQLSHFVPPDPLKKPWHSVAGFQGIIVLDDNQAARPMTLPGMFVGTLLLMLLGAAWVVRKWYRRWFK